MGLTEATTLRDMPLWLRVLVCCFAAAFAAVAHSLAQPLVDFGWSWGRGLVALLLVGVAVDLLLSATLKRWPWVLFLDLLVADLVGAGRRPGE